MKNFENAVHQDLRDIRQDIRELRQEINKYKGFIGGVVWAFIATTAAINIFISWFQKGGNN